MSEATFDRHWLQLREPVDHRSRVAEFDTMLRDAGSRLGWRRVVDLGGGTGSNVRYLAPRLPWATAWTVVDHDASLLRHIGAAPRGVQVDVFEADLRVEGDGLSAVDEADVVTASALLDLVSSSWLEELAERCARRSCGVLLALSVDGKVAWESRDPSDATIRTAFNRHQQREKGLGAALGPRAAFVARDTFEAAGFQVRLAPSPWILSGSADAALLHPLLSGWAAAACEALPDRREEIEAWQARRRRQVDDGDYAVTVGHQDLLALPTES